MIEFEIRNSRAIANAKFSVDILALIAGPNESGKTSLAHAVASAMLGQAVVLPDVKTSEAGSLIHAGAAKAEITIKGSGGIGHIAIPPSRYSSKGERPPRASRYALGLDSLVWAGPETSKVLLEYLKTSPTKEDLAAALSSTADVIDKIWKGVETLGWDGAHERAVDTGRKLKAQWELVTNDSFGTVKMNNWVPEGWSDDLAAASLESLQGEMSQAKEFLEVAISQSAVSAEERTRLKTTAANADGLKSELTKQEVEVRRSAIAEERARLAPAAETVTNLKRRIEQLRKTLIEAEAAAERKAFQTQALGLAGSRERLGKAKKELDGRQAAAKDAETRRRDLGEPSQVAEVSDGVVGKCPHCNEPVMFCKGRFIAAPDADAKTVAAEAKAMRSKIADADETVRRCVDRVTETERSIGALEAEVKRAEDAKAKLTSLPKADCVMSTVDVVRAIGVAEADLWRAEQAAEKLATLPDEASAQTHSQALTLLGQLQREFKDVELAKIKLKGLPAETYGNTDVNECRERVRLAEQRLEVWQKRIKADQLAEHLRFNLDIVAALDSKGVRQKKMAEKIGEFNGSLKALCTTAGWKDVVLDADDLRLSYGGWQYRLCSEGAKYRVRAILQIAMAQMDGSDLCVFDGADVMDGGKPLSDGFTRGRPGLIKLLAASKMPSLVLMTDRRENVADLARLGIGKSYWLSGGVLEPLVSAQKATA